MTYSLGGQVQATDYNGFVSTTSGGNVNATWNSAYGQTALATLSVGATVTATQWASLNSTISAMANHQNTVITSRTNPVAGGQINVLANVAADISSCYTNRANAYAQGTQFTGWTGTASKTTGTGTGTNAWTITFTNTVTFANTSAATYFFNAGGMIKIQFSKTSTGTTTDTEWNSFVNTVCGTVYLTSTGASKKLSGTNYTGTTLIGGTGTPTVLATSTGFAQLTSSPTVLYKQFDNGAAYSANYVDVSAVVSGGVLTLTSTWYDNGDPNGSAISGGSATTGISFGSAPATVVTYYPPETNYIANTWGAVTVASTVS